MKLDCSPITDVFSTKQEADKVIGILSDVADSAFSLKIPLLEKIEEEVPFSLISALEVFFKKNSIDLAQKRQTQEALFELIETIQNLPVLNIRIAFEPTGKQIKTIEANLAIMIDTHILINPFFEPEVIGGAVVEYGGKIGDYSLRNHIGNVSY